MPWPTPQDYNEAIQSPQLNFADPDLKSAKPELTPLGLPRPITGGFASVYRMKGGQKDWAVRCFLREFADQQQRYAAISKSLIDARLPYTVGFEFLSQGIRVQGKWYPILKMEWVEGELLNDHIRKHLRDQAMLLDLANRWVTLVKALQATNISHGDLQHGNILVVNGDFRLIDYDGMFVPMLAGQSSHEVGHRNYQHPLRTQADFGPYLDFFASWVIYVSLACLSIDPTLWQRVGAGDEFILFRKEDFDKPDVSSTFAMLTRHSDTRIQSLSSIFKSLLYLSPAQIPSLDGQGSLYVQPAVQVGSPRIDWLQDHVNLSSAGHSPATSPLQSPADVNAFSENSTWVLNFISQPTAVGIDSFSTDAVILRLVTVVSIGVMVTLLTLGFLSIERNWYLIVSIAGAWIILDVIVFVSLYHRNSLVGKKYDQLIRKRKEREHLASVEQNIQNSANVKKAIGKEEGEEKKILSKQRSNAQERERWDNMKVQSELQQTLASIDGHLKAVNQEEVVALMKAKSTMGQDLPRLNGQIASLTQAEADNLTQALQLMQKIHVEGYLKRLRLVDATISGIGPKLLARLHAKGIYTAAESEFWRVRGVEGIGENKARAISLWREAHLRQAQLTMPQTLSAADVSKIKSKYEAQRQQLEKQRDEIQQRLKAEETRIREHFVQTRRPLNVEKVNAHSKANRELQEIAERYAQVYASISQAENQLTTKYQDDYRRIDLQITQMRKQLTDIHWQLAKISHELKVFENVSFRRYVRFVFLGK